MWVVAPCGSHAASIAAPSSYSLTPGRAASCSAATPASVSSAARRIHSISSADLTSRSRVYAPFRSTSPSRAGRPITPIRPEGGSKSPIQRTSASVAIRCAFGTWL